MDNDPINQFFPNQDEVDLYAVLSVENNSTQELIKKAYRRLALVHHPDKHATSSQSARAEASVKFQQIGFAYAVLSDESRRKRYDQTGRTDEGFESLAGDDGWEAYFEAMFERVTRGKLDEMKKEYQGSTEEREDLKAAYINADGSLDEIMTHVPHSTNADETRFIIEISKMISQGDLPRLSTWERSVNDEKSRLVRKKQSDKEAKEAEKLAKELGVWDEFYGSGKTGERKSKGKGKGKQENTSGDEQDHSALRALILKKKEKSMDGFFDGLAAKYAEPSSRAGGRGKKRSREGEDEHAKKKPRRGHDAPPEINDEEFEKLQQKLFGEKAEQSPQDTGQSKSRKGRKAK